MNACIGIDFGGVIVHNLHQVRGEDTSLQSSSEPDASRDGAFDAIRQLCSACDGHVWIVSKAGAHACRSEPWASCSLSIASPALACSQIMCVSACSGKTRPPSV